MGLKCVIIKRNPFSNSSPSAVFHWTAVLIRSLSKEKINTKIIISIASRIVKFFFTLTESVDLGRLCENVVRLFHQHFVAHLRIDEDQALPRRNGDQRDLCIWTPGDRAHNLTRLDGLDAATGLNFPN